MFVLGANIAAFATFNLLKLCHHPALFSACLSSAELCLDGMMAAQETACGTVTPHAMVNFQLANRNI